MKNNKGFSLVELIIVIAIMAVLVGVLAPTYLQYVEKSKKANDVSAVDTIINAVEIAAIDPVVVADASAPTSLSITIDKTSITVTDGTTSWGKAVKEAVGDAKLKSFDKVEFTATRTAGTGKVTFAYKAAAAGGSNSNDEFKTYATSITKIS